MSSPALGRAHSHELQTQPRGGHWPMAIGRCQPLVSGYLSPVPAPFLTNQTASEAGCSWPVSIRWSLCKASNQRQALGDASAREASRDVLVLLSPGQEGL